MFKNQEQKKSVKKEFLVKKGIMNLFFLIKSVILMKTLLKK